MKKIEFIGASGTGKSTLFDEVVKRRADEDVWITPTEGRIQMAKKTSFQQYKSTLYRLMLLAIKLNLFKNSHPSMATLLLQKNGQENFSLKLREYDPVIKMFLQGITDELQMESYRKGQFLTFYLNLIETDFLMLEDISQEQLVVYDDGIIHNTEGITNKKYFSEMIQDSSTILEKIFPEGVVYCELSEDEVFKRRKNRIAAGKGTMIENNLTDQQLSEVCRLSIIESKRTIDILEAHSIPVLRIDMEKDQEENIDLVSGFIRSISENVVSTGKIGSLSNVIHLEKK